MKTKEIILDFGKFKVRFEDFSDLKHFFDSMDDQTRLTIAESIGWDNVFDFVIKRLLLEGDSWSCEDTAKRVEIVTKMEHLLLTHDQWSAFNEVREAAKQITSNIDIFSAMMVDRKYSDFFRNWLDDKELYSKFATENKAWIRFRSMFIKALNKMHPPKISAIDFSVDDDAFKKLCLQHAKALKELKEEKQKDYSLEIEDILKEPPKLEDVVKGIKETFSCLPDAKEALEDLYSFLEKFPKAKDVMKAIEEHYENKK